MEKSFNFVIVLEREMIWLAKTAGFCFGVKKALEIVESLLEQKEKVCTLGNIINNPVVVKNLKERGVLAIDSVFEAKKEKVLVIRSHGVGLKTYENIKKLNLKFKDATCPFVRRIQKKVFYESNLKKTILIAGDITHPEVVGIMGHCNNKPYVFRVKEFVFKKREFKILQYFCCCANNI